MTRKILHLDLDAFFCSVEELANPTLAGKAFAVGGRPQERGVVASCSYAARKFGVHSAMPMGRALRLCPELIVVPSRHGEYSRLSKQMLGLVREISPEVEQVSIDEAFVDATHLSAPGCQIAQDLQQRINQELRLPCSFGVAGNKLVAKIANDVGKAATRGENPPNTITVVEPGQEAAFLGPLPVNRLWGVGPKTTERLKKMNILTIGDLARCPVAELIRMFGKNGQSLAQHALGIDDSPVSASRETKSISQEVTFARDVRNFEHLAAELRTQSEQIGDKLRANNLAGKTVKIKVRWHNFATLTRQLSLAAPTNQDEEIFQAALRLFSKVWIEGQAVRLIGVGVSGFQGAARQLSLWDAADEKHDETDVRSDQLRAALDSLRDRYGDAVVRYAKKPDPEKP
ncbi:MAG: hypothetical protein B6D39_03445 [Anaerolineae bacterium UTCFX2]|jgi:DNA polymerase-4|nr:DNA polymerase IV [Anaerolineales bacterium]OQY93159.1 MAG: hypothetical protein B6D39_03445 [Anaerolineae bacterium UTCFX2]